MTVSPTRNNTTFTINVINNKNEHVIKYSALIVYGNPEDTLEAVQMMAVQVEIVPNSKP